MPAKTGRTKAKPKKKSTKAMIKKLPKSLADDHRRQTMIEKRGGKWCLVLVRDNKIVSRHKNQTLAIEAQRKFHTVRRKSA